MGQISEMKRILTSRKYIREFAEDYAERYGKNAKDVEGDIIQAKKLNHISFGEYEWTGHYERNPEQKKTMSTLWTRMEFRKKFTDRRYIGMLMNKYIFSKVFAEFYRRRCVEASEVNADSLRRLGEAAGQVVYKPNCKGMGEGIRILPVGTKEEAEESLACIRGVGNGIVEEYICQDALTSLVDIRTGKVLTDAVDQNEMVDYQTHPVTGAAFRGVQLRYWEETIAMLRRAVPLASKISNIGWDVTMTEEGPVLIEANTIPGFTTAQYSGYGWVTEGYGYQPLFDAVHGIGFQDDGRYEKVVLRLS